MTTPVLLSIVALCLFYSSVGWKAANPEVGSAYSAYYIDRSSGLSPVEQARLQPVAIGRTYSHQDEAIGFAWWSAPEPEHRWSDGCKAEIVFLLDNTCSKTTPRSLALKIHTAGRQRVKWRLNDSRRQEATLNGEAEWQIPLPSNDLRAGTNVLAFIFPDAKRPGGDDLRELAVALQSLRFD